MPSDDTSLTEAVSAALSAMPKTTQLVTERGRTHGDFNDHARASQNIKAAMHYEPGWEKLNNIQKEALEMFAHKIGRILAGDPNFKDHWDDIAGYAQITSERL
jgi:hypothetical protein